MPANRPLNVGDIPRGLAMVSGPCRCGRRVESGIGSGGYTYYICCVPLKDPRTGNIVGYGAECRVSQVPPPLSSLDPTVARDSRHALLDQIEPPPAGMTTAMYERYDADGVLLYVGVSDVLQRRTKTHIRRSTWFAFAASGSVQWFASRAEAESAEVERIRTGKPLFNRAHAHPQAREALVRYLIAKGRLDLLDVTARWG